MPKSGDSDRSIVCFGLVCFANVGIVGLCLIAINSIVLLPYWLSRDASVLFIPYGLGCTIINYSVRSVRHDQITTMYREERMCKYIFNVKFRLENTTNDKVASWKSRSWTKPNNFNLNCSVDDNNATVMFSPKPKFQVTENVSCWTPVPAQKLTLPERILYLCSNPDCNKLFDPGEEAQKMFNSEGLSLLFLMIVGVIFLLCSCFSIISFFSDKQNQKYYLWSQ